MALWRQRRLATARDPAVLDPRGAPAWWARTAPCPAGCRRASARASRSARRMPAALRQLTGSDAHQGVAALAAPFHYADIGAVLTDSSGPGARSRPDPGSAQPRRTDSHRGGRRHGCGGRSRATARRGISPAVEKVAAGAVNDVPICRAGNLHRCLLDLRELGYWSIALSAARRSEPLQPRPSGAAGAGPGR